MLEENKRELDAESDFELVTKLIPGLLILLFLFFIGYQLVANQNEPLPTAASEELSQGILRSVQSGRRGTMCFIRLADGEDLILRCDQPLYKFNVPITLKKKIISSGEVMYSIKGEL